MMRSNSLFPKKNKQLSSGMTLVELLVCVTVFAIIAGGLTSSFFSGVALWERVRGRDAARAEWLLDMESLARDFRQSVDLPGIGFEGTRETVSFPAVDSGVVKKVTYAVDAKDGRLTRSTRLLQEVLSGTEAVPSPSTTALLAGGVSFSYLGPDDAGLTWADSWSRTKGIFRAIRLEGVFQGEPFSRVIIVPIS